MWTASKKIEIRSTTYHSKHGGAFSILYLSDFHFNRWSEAMLSSIIKTIEAINPDIILLGGDYVDSKKGFVFFKQLLSYLSKRKHVFAVAGNHDYYFGIQKIRQQLTKNKLFWIEKTSKTIQLNGVNIRIDGNNPEKSNYFGFKILCLHHPLCIKNYDYDLAFAGHLHGGQVVLWQTKKGLYPARFFYKWNRLKIQVNSSLYLISKGLGDTLPIRYNCPKDVLFVAIKPKSDENSSSH